jgi:hypothetical protein
MCSHAACKPAQSIDKLRLPVSVRGGYLKKLDVEVPWTSLSSTVCVCMCVLARVRRWFSLKSTPLILFGAAGESADRHSSFIAEP